MKGTGLARLPQDRDENIIFYTQLYFQKYCFIFFLHEISQKTTAVSQIKTLKCLHLYSFSWLGSYSGLRPTHCWGFEILLRHTKIGRTPPDEWSASRRDLYLTTHTIHKRERETSMHRAGFEPAIPAGERPRTHALDRAAIGIDLHFYFYLQFHVSFSERDMDQTSSRVGQKRNRRCAEEGESWPSNAIKSADIVV